MTGSGAAGGRTQRVRLAPLFVLLWLLVLPGAALADSAVPTNYKSSVLDVEPDSPVADFAVVGGDAFLEITVAAGHSVLVPGYFDDPYIRIDPDGSVWVNHDSPAYYINQDRYGTVQAPPEADGRGEPEWEHVGDGGTYAWQDHRIHWMSYDLPPTVAGDRFQFVFPWEVPIEVDGQEWTVRGELVWVPSLNPYPALLAGAIGVLPIVWKRSRRLVPMALFATGVAIVASVITAAQLSGTPGAVRTIPVVAAAPPVAVAAALSAVALRRKLTGLAPLLLLVGGALLLVWSISWFGMLRLPVLPSPSWSDLQRSAASLVLWAAVAVVGASAVDLVRKWQERGESTVF